MARVWKRTFHRLFELLLTHPRPRLARVHHAGSNGLEQPPAIRVLELHSPQVITALSMSISKYFLIFIILLAQGIRAESPLVLTLDLLVNQIHRQNPDLAAACQNPENLGPGTASRTAC
jgi:hypothetical protein